MPQTLICRQPTQEAQLLHGDLQGIGLNKVCTLLLNCSLHSIYVAGIEAAVIDMLEVEEGGGESGDCLFPGGGHGKIFPT